MAFFASPQFLSYSKQLKNHRGFILIENSRDKSIHTHNIGGMDICEARAIINEQYEQYRIDLGDSFCDAFSDRRHSETSDDNKKQDQDEDNGGPDHVMPGRGHDDPLGEDQAAYEQHDAGVHESVLPEVVDPPPGHHQGGGNAADNKNPTSPDDQTSPIKLSKVNNKKPKLYRCFSLNKTFL